MATAHKSASIDPVAEAVHDRDWNFASAETDRLTHNVHRYSGKFIPQIAAQAIELLTVPGDLVVDPYCGSGTTLVEAASLGRRAIGTDLNPLAVLIASVKTRPACENGLQLLTKRFDNLVAQLEAEELFAEPICERDALDPRLSDPWYAKWYQPNVLRDLVVLNNSIKDEADETLRDIAMVAFSDILRRSSNAHQGYPNVMYDKREAPRPRPGRLFIKSLRQVVAAVRSLPPSAAWSGVTAHLADARCLDIPSNTADAVITHPPYVASIPYAEYGALSLRWLGHDPKLIDKQLTGGVRQSKSVLSRFTSDYLGMISESYRVLKQGGHFFTLVGNPTIRGELVDLSEMTSQHADTVGFKHVASKTRAGVNRRANKMGDETLLVFRKA